MPEENQKPVERNDGEFRSVNEDSPGIETMPDITPEMVSPNPPATNSNNSQDRQPNSDNEVDESDA